jgi:hypothetical protein
MVRQPGPRRWLMLVVVLCAALVVVLDGFIVNFVISVLVITLLSPGLSLFVLPLAGSLPPTTESESVAPEQKEGTKHVHQK